MWQLALFYGEEWDFKTVDFIGFVQFPSSKCSESSHVSSELVPCTPGALPTKKGRTERIAPLAITDLASSIYQKSGYGPDPLEFLVHYFALLWKTTRNDQILRYGEKE